MPTLHLGVAPVPYADMTSRKRAKRASRSINTYEVAMILEGKYRIMEMFYNAHASEIAEDLAESYRGATVAVMNGADPATLNPAEEGTSGIEDKFKSFLTEGEMEAMGIPGVPTKAALLGRSRRKAGGRYGGRRPSFVDTGLYQSSFRAWLSST